MQRRPLVAIPGRFAASTSALRYAAVVTAQALSQLVFDAGGEPVQVHPQPGTAAQVGERLAFADAVLLPGGGDLAPAAYGQVVAHEAVYDVDEVQDQFDLAAARWALDTGRPLLAVCRGTQVVNVLLGGDLVQHMDDPHRPVTHRVGIEPGSTLQAAVGDSVSASCYHHQQLGRLGAGLHVVARAEDGTPEGVELDSAPGWFVGVQWHPEDTAPADPAQVALVRAFLAAVAR